MEALGELLRAWPDDPAAERADARLERVELEIAAITPRTGAGLAVKLRLALALWASCEPITPDGGGSLPDGHDRVELLRRLVDEAEALDATAAPRRAGRG